MILPLFLLLAAAQHADHSTDRLPPANPLPIEDAAPAAVLAPVQAIVGARTAADVLAAARPGGGVTLVTEAADGNAVVRVLAWSDYAARASARVQERLTDPAVETDGAVATVWSPYVATIDNRLDHCGVDQAALVRENGRWRVTALTHSERTTGCQTRY